MNSTCDSVERLSLGAYVLGALDPSERASLDAHLARCEACRDELAELAAMPGLLSRVRLEDVLDPEPAPAPGRAERLIARLRSARRARRRRAGAVIAAAGLAIVIAAAVVISGGETKSTEPVGDAASLSAANGRTGVAASFHLQPAEWGTAVHVRLRGVRPKTRCELIAYSKSGGREVAGTWRATYEGKADVEASTAIPRDRLAAVEVVTAGGHRLVRATL
jgi:hypothetical protein